MKAHEFSVLGPLMGGFGSQAFLGCLHAGDGTIKPAVMVFLSDEIVDNLDLFRKVWAETELGTQIDHVNVIGVMGIAKLDEGYARVVDYADAESLRSVYRRALTLKRPLTAQVACSIVADACMGVHYAHELGLTETGEAMIHGGIRPETLQVSFQGMTKVTGYGATTIAEVARRSKGGDTKDAYTAPEQTYGGRAAATMQTDIYALGCVLYEALTGKAPFAADNDLAEAMIKDELQRRVDDEGGGVTEAMAQIVVRATKKKGTERYATALEMRHDLKASCEVADEKAIRRFMDELFPPDTVPRATRDQMLIAAREKPPAITGRLLTQIPPELSRATKSRTQAPSDAEVEAAQGSRVERAPPSDQAAVTAPPATSPPTANPAASLDDASAGDTTLPAQPAHETPSLGTAGSADTAPSQASAPSSAEAAVTAEHQPAAGRRSGRPKYVSPSGSSRVSAAYVSTAPTQAYAPAPSPPVVYRTPPGLLIGLGLAAGVAVALGVVMFTKSGDDKPQVVIQQPPPPPTPTPPPPPPPDPVPTPDPTPTPVGTPTGNGSRPKPADAPPPKATGPGTIQITADPASLAISVDGKALGTGSATYTGPAGKHKIVGKDAAQGITVTKTVTLKAGGSMSVELEAQKGRLAFDQLPDGVDVFIDGKKIGRTPLASIEVWAGPHKLKVQKGAAVVPYNINLPAGREMYITATFGE